MSSKLNKPVLVWLIIGAVLVASMVVLGGITRLTNSGLSMVEWKLVMGSVPPLSDAEWQATFEKYQQFPEYQKTNFDYKLADFKSIFWWEYSHRLLGRIIGIVFLVPFVIFWVKGYFNKKQLLQLSVLFVLGGLQGFLGWFMVKSGLVANPDVSHYRLAVHLVAAFFLFSYIIWLIMNILEPVRSTVSVIALYRILQFIYVLAMLQIVFGALVAGLNGGLFYPTFPTMNGEWMPAVIERNYSNDGVLSLVNNVTSIQFIHRWLGILLFLVIVAVSQIYGPSMLNRSKRYLKYLVVTVFIQAALGVSALLFSVPFSIAAIHQFTALVLIGLLVINVHHTRPGWPVPA